MRPNTTHRLIATFYVATSAVMAVSGVSLLVAHDNGARYLAAMALLLSAALVGLAAWGLWSGLLWGRSVAATVALLGGAVGLLHIERGPVLWLLSLGLLALAAYLVLTEEVRKSRETVKA